MIFFWAYVAGLLTLINPCVLPLLPIIIASSFQSNRAGPLALAIGLIVSFTIVGVGITAFGHLIGLDSQSLNRIASIMLIIFGVLLLLPQGKTLMTKMATPLADGANTKMERIQSTGLTGQFFIGILLGAVWSPCIGPTLGGAISMAASGENLLSASATMLAFGFGVATILMVLAYGSREILNSRRDRLMRIMPWAQPIMGVTMLIVGLILFFHLNLYIDQWLLDIMPVWLQDLSVRY